MSIAGGVAQALVRGNALGCTAIQIFTKNASRWDAKPYTNDVVEQFEQKLTAPNMTVKRVVAHSSYLPNLASPDDALWERSIKALADELHRCELLGVPYLIFHPGSSKDKPREWGIKRIAEGIDAVYETAPASVHLALENTAGAGNTIGRTFEEIADVISLSKHSDKLRFAFDTCHAFASGYDIRDEDGYRDTMRSLDSLLGLKRLCAVHMNDSKHPLGSHKDRHEHIGDGYIGKATFQMIMNDDALSDVPKILETPKGEKNEMDRKNLELLRSFVK